MYDVTKIMSTGILFLDSPLPNLTLIFYRPDTNYANFC